MESVSQVVKQDFEAALAAFEQDNFEEMNICANRLMGNAVFGNSDEIFLPGFFLKDVAGMYLTLRAINRTVAISTAKAVGSRYIKSLKEYCAGDRTNVTLAWVSYFQFYKETRKFFPSDAEKIYTDNLSFTRHSFLALIRFMNDKKDILLDPNNLLFKGILNEMERIFRYHSGELSDVLAISVIKALDRLYGYLLVALKPDGSVDKEKMERIIFPYVARIENLVYTSDKNQLQDVTRILWSIIKQWREFFIMYMEIAKVKSIGVERAIEISPEIKKKLAESISKTLEKEIKPGKAQ
jgi:hypothetical protein